MSGPRIGSHDSKQDYQTPPEFMNSVRSTFGQVLFDLAASPENNQCKHFFTEKDDSLSMDWGKIMLGSFEFAWLNPPFRKIEPWAKKCFEESKKGCYILMLVPASVGANWFMNYVIRGAHIYFLKDRIKFVGASTVYPRDCMLLKWSPIVHKSKVRQEIGIWSWKKNYFINMKKPQPIGITDVAPFN